MKRETVLKLFSFERFGLLIRNRLLEDLNPFIIVLGASAGVNLLAVLLGKPALFNRPLDGSDAMIWSAIIFLGGILLAARAFQQMHNGRGGSDWLLLPASPLEKYAAAFASYVLIYPVLASIASFCLSAALEGLALVFKVPAGVVFNPLSGLEWRSAAGYAIFASFALAASARFARLPLVKTGAIATAWGIALTLLFFGGLLASTPEGREALAHRHVACDFQFSPDPSKEPLLTWILRISCYVSGIFAVVYGYFRVAEKEAVDEVQ